MSKSVFKGYCPPGPKRTIRASRAKRNTNADMTAAVSTCSVSLVGIYSGAKNKVNGLEQETNDLYDKWQSTECVLSKISPLTIIAEPIDQADPKIFSKAGRYIDAIASETHRRIKNANNAIVLNVPDKMPTQSVKATILNACNMAQHICHCTRLRKRSPRYPCPLLFQFSNQ